MEQATLTESLRNVIGSSPQGTSLPTRRELCGRFGVSTFKLHQSLRQLEREGLVTTVPRKGIFVREPRPRRHQFIQTVFVDGPEPMPHYEYGLEALLWATGRENMECRVTHTYGSDTGKLRDILDCCANDEECFGVVIGGYVSAQAAHFLDTVKHPFVLLGDVVSSEAWLSLPVVCGDNFQAGLLAGEYLLSQECDHLVLVNLKQEEDWVWVREARAGVIEAADRHGGVRLLVVETADSASGDPTQAAAEVEQWIGANRHARVGVVFRRCCAGPDIAAPVCESLRSRHAALDMAVMGLDLAPEPIPGVQKISCPMKTVAQVTLRRLAAMRRGADSPGRHRVPFELVS